MDSGCLTNTGVPIILPTIASIILLVVSVYVFKKRPAAVKMLSFMLFAIGAAVFLIGSAHGSASAATNCSGTTSGTTNSSLSSGNSGSSSSGNGSNTNSSNNTPVTVTAVNDSLVRAYAASTPINIPILSNDTPNGTVNNASIDLDPSTAGIQQTLTTSAGTWAVQPDNTVNFTPSSTGTTSISYQFAIADGTKSNIATITVKTAQAPTANNLTDYINIDGSGNDTYDGPLTATAGAGQTLDWTSVDLDQTTAGIQHTVTVDGGTFTYDPSTHHLSFFRSPGTDNDVITHFTINDTDGLTSNLATVDIQGI